MRKKQMILFIFSFFCVVAAQSQIKYGVKAGLNMNKVDFSGLDKSFKADNTTGFFVGPMAEFKIPILGLGADASFLYSKRSSKFRFKDSYGDKTHTTVLQHSLEIPVNLKMSFGLGDMLGIFLIAGPDFIFNLKNDNLLEKLAEAAGYDAKFKNSVNRAELGFNVGGGVKLFNHLQIGLNYNIPLTRYNTKKLSDEELVHYMNIFDGKEFRSKNRIWQLSLAYLF